MFLCLKIGGTGGARHEFAAHISFFQILSLRFRKTAISMQAREGENSTPTHSRTARNSFICVCGSRLHMLWNVSIIPSRMREFNHHRSRSYRHCRVHMQFHLKQRTFHHTLLDLLSGHPGEHLKAYPSPCGLVGLAIKGPLTVRRCSFTNVFYEVFCSGSFL